MPRCVMTTRAGVQCSRDQVVGGAGFCWQHVPKKSLTAAQWRTGFEHAALVVAAADIMVKIVDLALKLSESFGSGLKEQNTAKAHLIRRFQPGPQFPNLAGSYAPGSRVDWIGLERLVNIADGAALGQRGADEVDAALAAWLSNMNPCHRGQLFSYIEDEAGPTE